MFVVFQRVGVNTCVVGSLGALLPSFTFDHGGEAYRHDAEFALVALQALTWRRGEESSTDAQNKGMNLCV